MERHWFVFYTKSRHEKKVRDLLIKNGYEPFLPLQVTTRQWSDRKKRVQTPLFNSYIFVLCSDHEIPEVVKVPGISANVRYNGRPAVLRNSELELIQRFLATGLFIETSGFIDNFLEIHDKVEVIDGPLTGVRGRLESGPVNAKFTVVIQSINQSVRVQLPAYLLKKVES